MMAIFPKISARKRLVLKAGMSLAFVGWLITAVEWRDVWGIARQADGRLISIFAGIVLVGMAISAWKWRLILEWKGFQRTAFACFRAYMTGVFVNNFLPGFIGGDAYRAHWLGKQREGYTRAVSTVVFDRFSGLLAAAALAVGFSLTRYRIMETSFVWVLVFVILTVIVCGSIVWCLAWRFASELPGVRLAVRFLPRKFQVFLEEVRSYAQRGIAVPTLSLSFAFQLIGVGLANLILFRAFGQTVAWMDFFAVIFLINIVASIPISVNNIGVKEWAYVTFFPLIGVSPEMAVTVALVGRFTQMLISFAALPEFLSRKRLEETAPV
jgi:uncharacterized protein (TIRG00374 family)